MEHVERRIELGQQYAKTKLDPCAACVSIKKKKEQEIACDECLPPLLPENEEVAMLYFQVRGQVIISPAGEVVDLKKDVLLKLIDLYDIKDKQSVFERVVFLHAKVQMEST